MSEGTGDEGTGSEDQGDDMKVDVRANLDSLMRELRAKEALFSKQDVRMIGFAYGYASAALDARRVDLAVPKVGWLLSVYEGKGGKMPCPEPRHDRDGR